MATQWLQVEFTLKAFENHKKKKINNINNSSNSYNDIDNDNDSHKHL